MRRALMVSYCVTMLLLDACSSSPAGTAIISCRSVSASADVERNFKNVIVEDLRFNLLETRSADVDVFYMLNEQRPGGLSFYVRNDSKGSIKLTLVETGVPHFSAHAGQVVGSLLQLMKIPEMCQVEFDDDWKVLRDAQVGESAAVAL